MGVSLDGAILNHPGAAGKLRLLVRRGNTVKLSCPWRITELGINTVRQPLSGRCRRNRIANEHSR